MSDTRKYWEHWAHVAQWAADHPGRATCSFPFAIYGDEATYSRTNLEKFTALTLQSPLLHKRKGLHPNSEWVSTCGFETILRLIKILLVIQPIVIWSGPAWTNTFLFFIVSSDKAAGTGGIDSVQKMMYFFNQIVKRSCE